MSRNTLSHNSADFLRCLASVDGNTEVIDTLLRGKIGTRMLQLQRILANSRSGRFDDDVARQITAEYALLSDVQRRAPTVFTALLLNPDVGQLLRNKPEHGDSPLTLIAAAAAVMSGTPAEINVPLRDGQVFLPGVGCARFSVAPNARGILEAGPDGISLTAGGKTLQITHGEDFNKANESSWWHPIRHIICPAGPGLDVLFLTGGPASLAFVSGNAPGSDLPGANYADHSEWAAALSDAWQIICDTDPPLASALSMGFVAIVPLPAPDSGTAVSSTIGHAFGCIGASLPNDAEALALTIVHEFHHSILAAALELIPLYDHSDTRLYYAPWRPDPRPLGAVLQGIYAHLSQARFWNARRLHPASRKPAIQNVEFLRWSLDALLAGQQIRDSAALNDFGRGFVDALMAEAKRISEQPAEEFIKDAVDHMASDHRILWRLHNFELPGPYADSAARCWLQGQPAPAGLAQEVQRSASPSPLDMHGVRMRSMWRSYSRVDVDPIEHEQPVSLPGDAEFLAGNFEDAFLEYTARIADDPADFEAWAGICLTAGEGRRSMVEIVSAVPEVAVAVYASARLLGSSSPDVAAFTRWLGQSVRP
jgi:HEXXH motif-containing protein